MAEPTLALAAVAGLASFLSPCVLPILPAFVAQMAGSALGYAGPKRGELFLGAALFVAGFSVVFAALGVALNAALGGLAGGEVTVWLSRLAGAVIIVLGLHLTGLLHLPILDRRYRPGSKVPRVSLSLRLNRMAPMLFGASFAVGWTPCVGPILGSTLALAAVRPASAFLLLVAYALGLGTPFLLVGLFPAQAFAFLKKHRRMAARLHAAFGVILVVMGVLVFTGELGLLASYFQFF